jgi:hypothetical protein
MIWKRQNNFFQLLFSVFRRSNTGGITCTGIRRLKTKLGLELTLDYYHGTWEMRNWTLRTVKSDLADCELRTRTLRNRTLGLRNANCETRNRTLRNRTLGLQNANCEIELYGIEPCEIELCEMPSAESDLANCGIVT